MSATDPQFPDEPTAWQVMGVLVHEAIQDYPTLRGKDHGIHFMPLAEGCYVVTEDHGRDVEYRIRSKNWCYPVSERSARDLADQLVTGLREAVKVARRGSGKPER